jgi:hypothetical protein
VIGGQRLVDIDVFRIDELGRALGRELGRVGRRSRGNQVLGLGGDAPVEVEPQEATAEAEATEEVTA